MKIQGKQIADICVLEIEGEVDAEHAPQLKKVLAKAREESAKNFVLDLKKVNFIDSTGLGVLISLMRQLKDMGGRLRLTGLQEEVRSIFEITRLFRVFDISPTVEEALQAIRNKN